MNDKRKKEKIDSMSITSSEKCAKISSKHKDFLRDIKSSTTPHVILSFVIEIVDEHGADAGTESYRSNWSYVTSGYKIRDEGIFFIGQRRVEFVELPMTRFSYNTSLIMSISCKGTVDRLGFELFTGFIERDNSSPLSWDKIDHTTEINGEIYPIYCHPQKNRAVDVIYKYKKIRGEPILDQFTFWITKDIYNNSVENVLRRQHIEDNPADAIF